MHGVCKHRHLRSFLYRWVATTICRMTALYIIYTFQNLRKRFALFVTVKFPCIKLLQVYKLQLPTTRRNGILNKTFNVLSVIALILTIIGAFNWLLIGVFDFNLVNWITFGLGWLERTLYILVGISGIYMLVWLFASRFLMTADYDERYSQHICGCNTTERTHK